VIRGKFLKRGWSLGKGAHRSAYDNLTRLCKIAEAIGKRIAISIFPTKPIPSRVELEDRSRSRTKHDRNEIVGVFVLKWS
jgi:hypothetical protein